MATVTGGATIALNMNNLQMANLQYGNVGVYDAALVQVNNGGGRMSEFRGAFAYAGGGMDGYYGYDAYGYPTGGASAATSSSYYPSSGTVTRVSEVDNGVTVADITGLAADAPTLFNAFAAKDMGTVYALVFGGSDQVNGGAQAETLLGMAGNDTISAGGGNDCVDGNAGNDSILGGDGNDFIRALEDNDTVDGGAGNDDINGNTGQDVMRGGDGSDFVRGGQGDDTVYGDEGDDVHVNGNIGNDVVFGGNGSDTLFGGQGNDSLSGEAGNDALSGDLGIDTLSGGAGADRFLIRAGAGADVVTDFNSVEGDRVQLAPGVAHTESEVGGSVVVSLGAGDQLTLTGVTLASLGDWLVVV